jgi:hypothetical protein
MLVALLLAADGGAPPPRELVCLSRHYAVTPVQVGGQWFGALPDGTRLPFDDGKVKTPAERLVEPDLQDIFAVPYRTGAIRPVTDEHDDPGRARVDGLLLATYGPDPGRQQRRIRFLGRPLRVHRAIVPALERVAARLVQARRVDPGIVPFLARLSGGFAVRAIAGTDRRSPHAYGIAVDLDKTKTEYWRWQPPPPRWRNRVPQSIVDAFEAEGFIWGGRWYHYDTMHFEFRPELVEPACRSGLSGDSQPPESAAASPTGSAIPASRADRPRR